MKRLVQLFMWFCAATVLAQICILGLSFFRGNLSKKAFVQIIALMNGIDIPGERLKNAIESSQEVPVPTRLEILDAKVQAMRELDTREQALERLQRSLQADAARQEFESKELARRSKELDDAKAAFDKGRQSETLAEVQRMMEIMPSDQAKVQLVTMMKKGQTTDVVAILKGMSDAVRKKIVAEFGVGDEDSVELAKILEALSSSDAKPVSQPSTAPDPSGVGT